MGTLYLNSGESIIQTTDRIGVNSSPSDLVLTTRRLILVDSTHGTAEPLMIPFATILSLQGGWNSNGDPVITLTLTDTGGVGSTQLLDLVFFQQSHEHRKEECDGWVKYLMDHIVLAHQKTICTDLPPADQERGMHPSIRRGVAPEMIRPHTTIASSRPVPSGEIMTPHQPDPLEVFTEEGEESPVAQIPVTPDVIDSSPVPEPESESPESTTPREPDFESAIAPETCEESPVAQIPVTPDVIDSSPVPEHEPESPESATPRKRDFDSSIVPEAFEESPVALIPVTPDVIDSSPVPEHEPESPESATPREPDFESAIAAKTCEVSPVAQIPETPDVIDSSPVPEHEPESPDTISSPLPEDIVLPEIHIEGASSMTTISPPEPEIVAAGEPPAGEIPPKTPSSPSPPPVPGSRSHTLIVAIVIGMILLAIAGGVGFYSLSMTKNDNRGVPPSTTPTPAISQTPQIPLVIIPQNGVWVRVVCNSTFLGWIGNPGSLHMVSGSGDQFYMIQNSDGLVQASFQKQEYTGDSLTIEIYNKGSLITHRTVRAPKGTIEFIIDANTGNPPGVPPSFTQ